MENRLFQVKYSLNGTNNIAYVTAQKEIHCKFLLEAEHKSSITITDMEVLRSAIPSVITTSKL